MADHELMARASGNEVVSNGVLTIWWQIAKQWRHRQMDIAVLCRLNDRALKDIGMHRSEIHSVVYGLNCDPSRMAGKGEPHLRVEMGRDGK